MLLFYFFIPDRGGGSLYLRSPCGPAYDRSGNEGKDLSSCVAQVIPGSCLTPEVALVDFATRLVSIGNDVLNDASRHRIRGREGGNVSAGLVNMERMVHNATSRG
jgi:hypothetical protein